MGGHLSANKGCFDVSPSYVVALLRVYLPPSPYLTHASKVVHLQQHGSCERPPLPIVLVYLPPPSIYSPPNQAVKNLLSWTHPPKTLLVYAVVAVAWLVLLVVPGRYIVLTLGLLEFSKAWVTGGQEPALVADGGGGTPSPLAIKLRNLLLR